MHRPDRRQQLLVHQTLQEVAPCARLQCPQRLRIAGIGRQHDNARLGEFAADGDDRVEAAHFGHLQIHQRDIRDMRPKLLNGLAAGRRVCNQLHVGLGVYQGGDARAHELVIVDGENANDSRDCRS